MKNWEDNKKKEKKSSSSRPIRTNSGKKSIIDARSSYYFD